MGWPHLQPGIGTQTWFCNPSSPWQKGTVENTNRRARRRLPRKRDIRAMTDNDIKQICDQLNNTPRKCLGWKTPAEVFREKMMEEIGRSPCPQPKQEPRFKYRSHGKTGSCKTECPAVMREPVQSPVKKKCPVKYHFLS